MRIIDFIDTVKTKCFKPRNKRPLTVPAGGNKKIRLTQEGNESTDVQSYDLKEISDDVRRRIVSWQNKLEDGSEVKELEEFTHYKVMVKLNSTETPSVTIYCELCNKPYKLARRSSNNTLILSNWTGHIKTCVAKDQKITANAKETPQATMQQQTLSAFIKSKKSQVTQSQSDSKSKVSYQLSTGSSKISNKEMSKPTPNQTENEAISLTTSCNSSAMNCNNSDDTQSEVSNAAQDFDDAPPGKVSQEGQFKSPKVYLNWSYAARKNKKRLEYDPTQLRLTEYLQITDKQIKEVDMVLKDLQPKKQSDKKQFSTAFFQQLLQNAYNNCSHLPQSRRHSEVVKKFSLSLLLRTGSTGYQLLHKNMPEALPSLSTVQREAAKQFNPLSEGEFAFDQLSVHLKAYNAPRIVSISEDATRVITRIEYDPNSNKLVGFVLPLDTEYLPIGGSFLATSFDKIEQMFLSTSKASSAYIYVAQPLSPSAPPFCLCLIGTDNRFDANSVTHRWKYMIKECKKRNIEVVSFSADGDSRLLTSMRVESKLYNYSSKKCKYVELANNDKSSQIVVPKAWKSWFFIEQEISVCFVQDPIHLGVKLKARLLTVSQILPLGKYSAIATHLHLVQASYSKEHHNLRLRDLDHQDRQNFEAVSRIISPNVLGLLDTLPNAKGTKLYLQVVKSIVDSFLDKQLEPLSRIEEAWFALFFTRYWRQWVLSSAGYNLENNFISLNSYVCIELNAHALILLLMILRNSSAEQCYCPWLLGSQPCEKAFRAARSMTPTFSTIVNFNVLGLLRRLHKLQIQIELESQSSTTGIIYPQQNNRRSDISDGHRVKNITDFEIEQAVKSALERAKNCMEELGMKDLLQRNKNWDKVSFGDVDDVEDN